MSILHIGRTQLGNDPPIKDCRTVAPPRLDFTKPYSLTYWCLKIMVPQANHLAYLYPTFDYEIQIFDERDMIKYQYKGTLFLTATWVGFVEYNIVFVTHPTPNSRIVLENENVKFKILIHNLPEHLTQAAFVSNMKFEQL